MVLCNRRPFYCQYAITQVIDGMMSSVAKVYGPNARAIAVLIGFSFDIGLAALFVGAGLLGRKRHQWAIYAVRGLYIIDSVFVTLLGGWLRAAFQVVAIVGIAGALKAMNDLIKLEKAVCLRSRYHDCQTT